MKFDDINYDDIIIRRMYRRDMREVVDHTKGTFGARIVPLTDAAKEIIELAKTRHIERNGMIGEYIFSLNNKPCGYYAISDLYRKYCEKLGITVKSSQKVRKTVISEMIDADISINTIREMVGHQDARTTYRNYCFDRHNPDEIRGMINDALK